MEKLSGVVRSHVAALEEHFDCVQVFCSNLSHGGEHTHDFHYGGGNIHTRINQSRSWVIYQDEMIKVKARNDCEDED